MCLGVPMTVIECDDVTALCERHGERRRVSVALVGRQAPGSWLLVHIDTAVQTLQPDEALLIDDALAGLEAAMRGESVDHLFTDLVDREPELPAHLRASGKSAA